MPAEEIVKSSWADEMDDNEESEKVVEIIHPKGNLKQVTEQGFVDGERVKIIRTYRIEKRKVPKCVAIRKRWSKYGLSANDRPGPNLATTITSQEDIRMEFLLQKEEEVSKEQEQVNQFGGNQSVQCRNCGLNHWTLHCPYKDQLNALNKLNEDDPNKDDPRLRKPGMLGFGKRGVELSSRPKDENNTIRITNLPEETQDSDIRDLFKDFGRITRIFLAKDKATGNSKGFAFVSFEMRDQATRAIKTVNGHGYNNLILSVEWARPSAN